MLCLRLSRRQAGMHASCYGIKGIKGLTNLFRAAYSQNASAALQLPSTSSLAESSSNTVAHHAWLARPLLLLRDAELPVLNSHTINVLHDREKLTLVNGRHSGLCEL